MKQQLGLKFGIKLKSEDETLWYDSFEDASNDYERVMKLHLKDYYTRRGATKKELKKACYDASIVCKVVHVKD